MRWAIVLVFLLGMTPTAMASCTLQPLKERRDALERLAARYYNEAHLPAAHATRNLVAAFSEVVEAFDQAATECQASGEKRELERIAEELYLGFLRGNYRAWVVGYGNEYLAEYDASVRKLDAALIRSRQLTEKERAAQQALSAEVAKLQSDGLKLINTFWEDARSTPVAMEAFARFSGEMQRILDKRGERSFTLAHRFGTARAAALFYGLTVAFHDDHSLGLCAGSEALRDSYFEGIRTFVELVRNIGKFEPTFEQTLENPFRGGREAPYCAQVILLSHVWFGEYDPRSNQYLGDNFPNL